MNYYIQAWQRIFDYKERSTRMEFWLYGLINMAIVMALYAASAILPSLFTIASIYSLISWVPAISLGVRRLHDRGMNGWFILVSFIPFWGSIFSIVFGAIDSKPGENKYGPNPKGIGN